MGRGALVPIVLVLAAGCPHRSVDSVIKDPSPPATVVPATPTEQPASEEEVAAPIASSSGTLELDHLHLGMEYEAAKARAQEAGHRLSTGMWVDTTGNTGALKLTPANGQPLPADDLYFVNGRLVGFFKRTVMTTSEFDSAAKFYVSSYAEGAATPPDWAAGAGFFAGLPGITAPARRLFWEDKQGTELLFAEYDPASKRAMFGLLQPAACDELGITYTDLLAEFEHPVSAPRTMPHSGDRLTTGRTG